MYNLVQLMTMSAADFLDQWFETDVLKATMSASGIIGTFLGVRSPGTAYVLLHHYMGEIDGAFRAWGFSRGGTGAISNAIGAAAREAGVDIRMEAGVERILVKDGRATGVVLEGGEEIQAEVVASSLDPRMTFERMIGEREAPAGGISGGSEAVQVSRIVGKGKSGAGRPAGVHSDAGSGEASARGDFHFSGGGLHGAGVRPGEIRGVFAAAVH